MPGFTLQNTPVYDQGWKILAPRPFTLDQSTGNRRPGTKPTPVDVGAVPAERYPLTAQRELSETAAVDEQLLLVEPTAGALMLTNRHHMIDPAGVVWSIVRIPRLRQRRRSSWTRTPRYIVVVIRQATDIKE